MLSDTKESIIFNQKTPTYEMRNSYAFRADRQIMWLIEVLYATKRDLLEFNGSQETASKNSRAAVDLWQRSRPKPGPKLSVRVPGNIRQRFHTNERHTVHANIKRQSRKKGIPLYNHNSTTSLNTWCFRAVTTIHISGQTR